MSNTKLLISFHRVLFYGAIFIGCISQASATTSSFCIGEKKEVCNVTPTYDCGTNPEPIIQSLCVQHNPDGTTQKLPYTLNEKVFDGNHCGYHVYTVECVTK
jgi:hypothetical protein